MDRGSDGRLQLEVVLILIHQQRVTDGHAVELSGVSYVVRALAWY